jgi:hypothetical protein
MFTKLSTKSFSNINSIIVIFDSNGVDPSGKEFLKKEEISFATCQKTFMTCLSDRDR